jgi:circadian clock protein KaiC
MFHPSELELTQTIKGILEEVTRIAPRRVVIDSLSELRLLAGNPLRYRRQFLALKQFFTIRRSTVLALDDLSGSDHDRQVHSIAHGVIRLELAISGYGAEGRCLHVVKYRGRPFRSGRHDYVIRTGGMEVFPRLVAAEHRGTGHDGRLPSGITALDDLLGGGLQAGTSTLIAGAPGTGKSSLAAQFVTAAANRGGTAAMFLFDEQTSTLLGRAAGLGLNLREHVESGRVRVQAVDPAELSPGQLVTAVRQSVERDHATVIVIDSLNGYLNSMPHERHLTAHLHELLAYLAQRGVASILIGAHQGFIGAEMSGPIDASYLADSVILIRYFEAFGEVRLAMSVIKKRGGRHERTIREFALEDGAVRVGAPLREFRGVLSGLPVYEGAKGPLLTRMDES